MPVLVSDRSAVNHMALGLIVPLGYEARCFLGGDDLSVTALNNGRLVAIGTAIVIPAGSAASSVVIGDTISTSGGGRDPQIGNVLIGRGITQGVSSACVQVGTGLAIGDGSNESVCIGEGSTILATAQGCLAIGPGNTVGQDHGGHPSLSMGIGAGNIVTGVKIVAVGTGITVTPATLAEDPQQVVLGHTHSITGTMPGGVVIGTGLTNTTDWSAGTNNLDHTCVAIGRLAGIASDVSVTASVLMGVPALTSSSTNYGIVVAIGFNTITTSDDSTNRIEVVGTLNTVSGKFLSCYGHGNAIAAGCLDVVIVGENCSVSANCSDIVAIGDGANLTTSNQQKVVNIGSSNVVQGNLPNGTATERIVVIGASNSVGNTDENSRRITVLGSDNTSGEGGDTLVIAGANNTLGIEVVLSFVVGSSNQLPDGSQKISLLGCLNTLTGANPTTTVILGDTNHLAGDLITASVVLGTTNTLTGPNVNHIVMIGSGNSTTSHVNCTIIGQNNVLTSVGSQLDVIIGQGNEGPNLALSIVLGNSNIMPDGAGAMVVIGNGIAPAAGTVASGRSSSELALPPLLPPTTRSLSVRVP